MNVSSTSATETETYTQLYIVRFDDVYNVSSQTADDVVPTVLQCTLKWCAHYHNASRVHHGTLLDPSSFIVKLVPRHPLASNGDPASSVYVPDENELTVAQSILLNQTHTEFLIDQPFSQLFTGVLATTFQNAAFRIGVSTKDPVWAQIPEAYRNDWNATLVVLGNQWPTYLLYTVNDGNVTKTFDNVALSVTNTIRSAIYSSNVTGTVIYPTVYIQVVWPWYILPVILTISAAALLFVTIWLSSGHGAMVWKSSSLALLFHGSSSREDDARMQSARNMEIKAKQTSAQLAEDDVGAVRLRTT